MAFRFRKSVKLAPGIRLNFSRSGVSTTLGGRGFSVNAGPRGTYVNAGIPGTGLRSRSRVAGGTGGVHDGSAGTAGRASAGCVGCGGLGVLLMLFVGFCSAMVSSPGGGASSNPPFVAATPDTASTAAQQRETLYAHAAMNIRSGAGTSYGVVRTVPRGESIEVGPVDAGGWAPVYDGYRGQIGYVYRASRNLRAYAPPTRTRTEHEPRGAPSGATAICRDGSYSYSAHRRGTCSHHGGVAQWL